MGIIESDFRRTDIMPSSEAQREASEVVLGWREAVILTDEESGEQVKIRVKNFIQVFVSRSNGEYVGNKPLFDGQPFPCELGGKSVTVTPTGFSADRRRIFEISRAEGIIVTSGQTQEN